MSTTRKRGTRGAPPAAEGLKVAEIGALLEDLRTQQTAMLEAMQAWGERLERKIDFEVARLHERIDVLEAVVRRNSEDIKKNSEDIRKNSEDIRKNSEDIKKNSEDIKRLSAEVDDLRDEVKRLRAESETRDDRAKVLALEARVTDLERRLGVG